MAGGAVTAACLGVNSAAAGLSGAALAAAAAVGVFTAAAAAAVVCEAELGLTETMVGRTAMACCATLTLCDCGLKDQFTYDVRNPYGSQLHN